MDEAEPNRPTLPVESLEQSVDSSSQQLVDLSRALLDGAINRQTYDELASKLRQDPYADSSVLPYAQQSPTRSTKRLIYYILEMAGIVLLVLVLVSVMSTNSDKRGARQVAAQVDVENLATALDAFKIDSGGYPTSAEGLAALAVSPAGVQNWRGPYVKRIPVDPWGNPYNYISPGLKNPKAFDLSSAGPDGKLGTADDILAQVP